MNTKSTTWVVVAKMWSNFLAPPKTCAATFCASCRKEPVAPELSCITVIATCAWVTVLKCWSIKKNQSKWNQFQAFYNLVVRISVVVSSSTQQPGSLLKLVTIFHPALMAVCTERLNLTGIRLKLRHSWSVFSYRLEHQQHFVFVFFLSFFYPQRKIVGWWRGLFYQTVLLKRKDVWTERERERDNNSV